MSDYTDNWLEESGVSDIIDSDLVKDLRFKDAKVLLWVGHYCGWQITRGPGGFVILTSADHQRIEIPNNDSLNMGMFRSRVRKILRHRSENIPMAAMMNKVVADLKVDASHAHVLHHLAEDVQPVGNVSSTPPEETASAQPQPESVPSAVTAEAEMEPAPVSTGRRKRRITKQEPWSAHKGSTREGVSTTYPSQAVMERSWSDGTTDFACRWEGCHYTHETPHSVSSHFAGHRRGQGTAPQPPVDGIDPDYTPQKRARIRRLRSEIDGALTAALAAAIDWTQVDQAEWLAEWIINHRVEPLRSGSEEDPREMTAEELLDKIAALCDRGRSVILREQNEMLNHQLDQVTTEIEETRVARDLAEARAIKAHNTLKTWKELIVESDDEDETEVTE